MTKPAKAYFTLLARSHMHRSSLELKFQSIVFQADDWQQRFGYHFCHYFPTLLFFPPLSIFLIEGVLMSQKLLAKVDESVQKPPFGRRWPFFR